MKKLTIGAFAVLLLVSASGCYGPMEISRQLDDWGNQLYVDSPWLAQLCYYTFLPFAYAGAMLADSIALNPYRFWSKDAFEGKGTPFKHKNPN